MDSCVPKPKVTKGSKKDFLLILLSNEKLPLKSPEKNCHDDKTSSLRNPEEIFINWFQKQIQYEEWWMYYRNIVQETHETSPVDKTKVQIPFLSKTELLDIYKVSVNLTLFNGLPATFMLEYGGFDIQLQLHGVCHLIINIEHEKHPGAHPLLNWKPVHIQGRFIHGQPEGTFYFGSMNNNIIWATFKQGVLHGPIFAWGVNPILDMEVKKISKIFFKIFSKKILNSKEVSYQRIEHYLVNPEATLLVDSEMVKHMEDFGLECKAMDTSMELSMIKDSSPVITLPISILMVKLHSLVDSKTSL
jgi:hypothetical protein